MEEPRRPVSSVGIDGFIDLIRGAREARQEIGKRIKELRRLNADLPARLRRAERDALAMAMLARKRNHKRKPPEAGLAMPVEPPRGPLPMAGGAEAPLNFER